MKTTRQRSNGIRRRIVQQFPRALALRLAAALILSQVCVVAEHARVTAPPRIAANDRHNSRTVNAPGVRHISSLPLEPRRLIDLGRIGIISSTLPRLSIQRPLTKAQAVRDARENTGYRLDELMEVPFVNLAVPGLAIAHNLTGQAVGAARGLTEERSKAADNAISLATAEMRLQDMLRNELHRQATQASSHPIVLVKKPFPEGMEAEFSKLSCVMAATLAWVPRGQTPTYYLTTQGIDTAIEIQLVHPGLRGKGTINPPMTLSMEVRSRVFRVTENQDLYRFAMNYRSTERKYTEWAANNAQALRTEMQHCAQVVAATIIDQLSLRSLATPAPPTLANIGTGTN